MKNAMETHRYFMSTRTACATNGAHSTQSERRLLDLRFFELNVLTDHRIVLFQRKLVRCVAAVFLCGVKETGSCR